MIERIRTAGAIGALLTLTAACDQEPAAQSAVSDAASKIDGATPELSESAMPAKDGGSETGSN